MGLCLASTYGFHYHVGMHVGRFTTLSQSKPSGAVGSFLPHMKLDHQSLADAVATGGTLLPRLKSSALQAQILKSLKSMPRHTFKAPDTNILKSDKSLRAADEGDGCLA